MRSEKTITVRLTEEQADEAVLACLDRYCRLEKVRQRLIAHGKTADEIAKTDRRISLLHRVECTLGEAAETAETQRNHVTLAAILALFHEEDHVSVLRRMGPHECECVAGGTAQALRSTRCAEVCGGNVVERLALGLKNVSDETVPALFITISCK